MAYIDHMSGARIAAHTAYSQALAGNLIAGAVLDGIKRVRLWISARKALRELRLLDAHLLKDIGLEQADIPAETPSTMIGMSPRI